MGASRDDFWKYPRTPHVCGSRGTADDRHLGKADTAALLADPSLIVEEKLDGTNVGIHFTPAGRMVLQSRGHEITAGMHAQYDLFKQWASAKRAVLEDMLADRLILYGEWLYARHSIHYRALAHYFFEFDILEKSNGRFLTFAQRLQLLASTGLETVPVIHRGATSPEKLQKLLGHSAFGAHFIHPQTNVPDDRMEGLYLRTESADAVTARAKLVRPEFVEKIKQSEHWQHQILVPNDLAAGKDLWS